jgi:hypothetical protein
VDVTLASLRPVLEYGWPAGARWIAGDNGSASLEQPLGAPVAFRLRAGDGWRLRAEAGLPEGASPAMALARVGVREAGGKETAVWSGLVGRAGRALPRRLDVGLTGFGAEFDLVLHAIGRGADRIRWVNPALHRGDAE